METDATSASAGFQGVSGLASGIDTDAIIEATIEAERGNARILESKKAIAEAKLEAVNSLNVKLLNAKLDLSNLKRTSTLGSRSVSTGDANIITAKVDSNAELGTYRVTVDQIATADERSSQGFTSASAGLGTGTVSVQMGNGALVSITVDETNNTLEGLASAINAESDDVDAKVIYDGEEYKLLLSGSETGEGNDITFDASGLSGGESATLQSAFDVITAADDAIIRYGASQATALEVTSSTNVIDDLISGVTLDLKNSGTDPIVIEVTADVTAAQEAITQFVTNFNDAQSYLNDNASYNPETNEAGILLGVNNLRRGMDEIIRTLSGVVPGLESGNNLLSGIGITLDEFTNELIVDEAQLTESLESDLDSVIALFTSTGESDNVGIEFVTVGGDTDTTNPFEIVVTQAATQAHITGPSAVAGTSTIDSSNNTLELSVNGTTYSLELNEGTYNTDDELVAMLQGVIDSTEGIKGKNVLATLDGSGNLNLRTERYGSSQSLLVVGGNVTDFGLNFGQSSSGRDVIGTINGEEALGTGQALRAVDEGTAKGLAVLVTLTQDQIDGGNDSASVTGRKGLAQLTETIFDRMLDNQSGTIPGIQNTLNEEILDLDEGIDAIDARLDLRRARLENQFLQMEILIQELNSQAEYIAGQVEGFQNLAANASGRN